LDQKRFAKKFKIAVEGVKYLEARMNYFLSNGFQKFGGLLRDLTRGTMGWYGCLMEVLLSLLLGQDSSRNFLKNFPLSYVN
jgi:hypothetical protein